MRQEGLVAFPQERGDGRGERRPERRGVDRADMSLLESSEALRGQIVVVARLHRGESAEEAGERERVVAHGTGVMLGLPDTAPLDARARVERVDDASPEDGSGYRRRRDEQVPGDG